MRAGGDAGLRGHELSIWALPLFAGLLPATAALLALVLYAAERGSFCNPFVQDCVSISRMAKHGLANPLFRLLVLPGAVLQALTWWVAARALQEAGVSVRRTRRLLALGVGAALTLVVYGSFLGTDGRTYEWLRRWGPLLYFGGTYVAMLLFMGGARDLDRSNRRALPRAHACAMVALSIFIAGVALSHGFAAVADAAALEDRIENLSEWWGSFAMTLMFVMMALLWRRWALSVTIHSGGTGDG